MQARTLFRTINTLTLASAIALCVGTIANAASSGCTFKSAPTILIDEGDPQAPGSRLLQVWEEPDERSFWGRSNPSSNGYLSYVSKLAEQKVETDPVRLLRASRSFNNDLVVRNAKRWIRPATCLEKLLIGQQNARMDLLENTTEFVAVVLRRPGPDRLRVYSYTVNRNGIGRMSAVTDPTRADIAAGWRVDLVIHNHSFFPRDRALNGLLAPSLPDAHFQANFARSHGVREARITNGIDTIRMPAETFGLFAMPQKQR